MKKTFLIALSLFAAVSSFAQKPDMNHEQFKKEFERIRSEKIAYFTAELDLSPEEAQVFWPVYNEFWKDYQSAHGKVMEAFRALRDIDENTADSKTESLIDNYVKAQKDESTVSARYSEKFKKVLPLKKVAKLYQAEESFRMKMIHTLRGPKHPGKEKRDAK